MKFTRRGLFAVLSGALASLCGRQSASSDGASYRFMLGDKDCGGVDNPPILNASWDNGANIQEDLKQVDEYARKNRGLRKITFCVPDRLKHLLR